MSNNYNDPLRIEKRLSEVAYNHNKNPEQCYFLKN
jgi:hypothetical protein